MPLSRRLLLAGGAGLAAGPALAVQLGQQPAPSRSGLVVGALLPLSGDLSLVGDECLRGIELAAAPRLTPPAALPAPPSTLFPATASGKTRSEPPRRRC